MGTLLRAAVAAAAFYSACTHAALITPKPLLVTYGDPHDPQYQALPGSGYDGVAFLSIESAEQISGCTGALLTGGTRLLTAAHCLTDGSGVLNALSLTASFDTGAEFPYLISAKSYHPHPLFDGMLQHGYDIAIVVLDQEAPPSIPRYEFYSGSSEIGSVYEVVGYGANGSGNTGVTSADLVRRRGANTFDASMAETFGAFPGWIAGGSVLVSDFDNGNPANDALGVFYGIHGLGLGLSEVSMAPGDSGAPAFIDGRIAGIASFHLRLSFTDGSSSDIDGITNASFGEFNAFTRISSYEDWLLPVPEPGTAALCLVLPVFCALRVLLKKRDFNVQRHNLNLH